VTAILLPQPNAQYVRRNLLAGHAAGSRLIARDTVRGIAATVAWRTAIALLTTGRRPYIIPAGGSSPIGVLGYVNAALELREQIDAGAMQAPDRIYFSLGSMGTAAGLAIGLELAGIDAELQAVRVVDTQFGSREKLAGLVRATLKRLREWVPDFPAMDPMRRVIVRDEFYGARYGEFTQSGVAAVHAARDTAALRLDGTYSGKAFGALLSDAAAGELRGKRVLFWNTHNSGDVDALGASVKYRDLPRAFRRYFEEPVQSLDPGA
jgi:D-cysteine desulfhydrase